MHREAHKQAEECTGNKEESGQRESEGGGGKHAKERDQTAAVQGEKGQQSTHSDRWQMPKQQTQGTGSMHLHFETNSSYTCKHSRFFCL